MGCGEAAGKLSLEEDLRTSTKGGLSRPGISSHATMRQGVNQPCGIRGSWGCGPALPSVPGDASLGGFRGIWRMEDEDPAGGLVHCCPPTSPPPLHWHGVSTTLRRQQAAGAAAGAAALAVDRARTEPGREGESRRWQAGQARLRRG